MMTSEAFELGLKCCRGGDLAGAEQVFRAIVQADSLNAQAWALLGAATLGQGRAADALPQLHQAVSLDPSHVDALGNLGIALFTLGRLEEAVACFQHALQLRPDFPEGRNNLGNALVHLGRLDEAVTEFQYALRLRPDYVSAHHNLANALLAQGKPDEAAVGFRQVLVLRPNFAAAHNNLGNVLLKLARHDEAVESFRRAIALDPANPQFHSNLLYGLHFHPQCDAPSLWAEHQCWSMQHAEPLKQFIQPHNNRVDSERRLKIGYVSPHFCDHCLALFLIPLLSNHDHRQVEVFCYADVPRPDALTTRMQGCADHWCSTSGQSDANLAELIRGDQIDILVDLSLHMERHRLLVFARKPAPVQVTWLGYPSTTGLDTIDYRLTDSYLDPPGTNEGFSSEQVYRLPDAFWCYDPLASEPLVNALPAEKAGHFTFGCLNNFCKVNQRVLKLWARVLLATPESRMCILCPGGTSREQTVAEFLRNGVAADRVEFVSFSPRGKYLEQYHRIDLALDTFPYNSHTTGLDALWMGVPTITLVGETAVGRAGWCELSNVGLTEFAAQSEDDFVRIATDTAADLPRLAELRSTLRQRLQASPLMDGPRFARNLETAYRTMWRRWCETALSAGNQHQ
jgi:protein O-GlcNAc transferase